MHHDDADLHERIERLVEEEHALLAGNPDGHGLSDADRARVRRIEVALDRAWEVLRERAALREAGYLR